jgi:hypothetical protein
MKWIRYYSQNGLFSADKVVYVNLSHVVELIYSQDEGLWLYISDHETPVNYLCNENVAKKVCRAFLAFSNDEDKSTVFDISKAIGEAEQG